MKMRLSRIIVKVTLESKITKFGFGRNFNDMEYYKLGISVTWIHYKLEGIIKKNGIKTINLMQQSMCILNTL
jgi:hypothetical protein